MTESWKSEKGDSKSTQSHVSSSVQGTSPYGNDETGTRISQWNRQNDRHEYVRNVAQQKYETPTWAPTAHGKLAETNQGRCKAMQVEPPQIPKGSDGAEHMGRRPSARAKRPPMTETVSRDTVREGRQCDGIDQRDRLKEKGGGHAQDIARERQQSPPQKRTRPPPRRSEGWNEWATPTWPPTEEQTRDRCQTPEGEGPSREGRTLADSLPQWGPQ